MPASTIRNPAGIAGGGRYGLWSVEVSSNPPRYREHTYRPHGCIHGYSDKDLEEFNAYKKHKDAATANEQELAKRAKNFSSKTGELFSENFEGFGFNVSDNNKIVYKPADSKTLLNEQSDLNNFVNKFTGEDGAIKDYEGFHRSIAVASNPEKFAKYFYEKGMADAVGDVAKESKNIDMTRQSTKVIKKDGFQVRSIDADRGNRLIIKKSKN